MNKGSEMIAHFKKKITKFKFYELKWSPCSVLWWLSCSNSPVHQNEQIFSRVNSFISFIEWTNW